jgi:hypothetical protein
MKEKMTNQRDEVWKNEVLTQASVHFVEKRIERRKGRRKEMNSKALFFIFDVN